MRHTLSIIEPSSTAAKYPPASETMKGDKDSFLSQKVRFF